jgi:diketogulonate reductase-like aldo/keto reductase
MDIPRIGLGTFQANDPASLEQALTYAIEEVGYRYIDTAEAYENEEIIGNTLQKIFSKGKIKREDIFVTSKLWSTHRRPEKVEQACRDSLKRLKFDYLDLYLIHNPIAIIPQEDGSFFPQNETGGLKLEHVDILDTWNEMEKLVDLKLTKRIGVSSFSIEMLERMEFSPRVRIQPYTNQVEHHIYLQQHALIQYLERRGISLTSYSSLGQGIKGPFGVYVHEDEVVVEIAKEIGKTPAQVALKFVLQLSPIVNIIPKSVTPSRIKENFVLDFELNEKQLSRLKARNQCWRKFDAIKFFGYDIFSIGV